MDGPKLKVKNMYGIYSWERENSPKLKIKTMYGIYCWEPDKTLRKYTAGKERVVHFFSCPYNLLRPLPRLSDMDKFTIQ